MSSLLWIEPRDVHALVGRLHSAKASSAVRAGAAEAPRTSDGPAVDGPRPAASARATAPPAKPGKGLAAELERFLDEGRRETGFSSAFVADHEGLAVTARGASEPLIAAGVSLVERWQMFRDHFGLPGDGRLVIELGEDGRLVMVPAETPWGVMSLGLVTTKSLSSDRLQAIAHAFARVFAERGEEKTT